MRANLADGSKPFGRDLHDDKLFEFRHVNPSFLDIGLSSPSARRVELRGARTV